MEDHSFEWFLKNYVIDFCSSLQTEYGKFGSDLECRTIIFKVQVQQAHKKIVLVGREGMPILEGLLFRVYCHLVDS